MVRFRRSMKRLVQSCFAFAFALALGGCVIELDPEPLLLPDGGDAPADPAGDQAADAPPVEADVEPGEPDAASEPDLPWDFPLDGDSAFDIDWDDFWPPDIEPDPPTDYVFEQDTIGDVSYEDIDDPGTCTSDADCNAGEFCDHETCYVDSPGACSSIPEVCTAVYDPVCGCDGYTYSNDCERRQAMVSLAHTGVC
jgi:hypothetical protein